jgi:hypothetical protein
MGGLEHMKKTLCILIIIVLIIPMFGCDLNTQTVEGNLSPSLDDDKVVHEGPEDFEVLPNDDMAPAKNNERESGYPKITEAPVYSFNGKEFLIFDGNPVVSELSNFTFLDNYSRLYNIPGNELDKHNFAEAIELANGGEFLELLSDTIINADDSIAARRAVIINKEQQPWTMLHVRLFYPAAVTVEEEDANSISFDSDMVTILSNCDALFVKNDFMLIYLSSTWGDKMAASIRWIWLDNGTFLKDFD